MSRKRLIILKTMYTACKLFLAFSMQHVLKPVLTHVGVSALILFSALGFLALAPQAQAANDVSLGMTLLDTDGNGELNRISLSIDNDAAETWTINGTPGFTITQGGEAVTVSSVAFSSATNADPIVIFINVNESTTDVDTDGVNSNAVEVTYAQAGGGAACTNCIRDTGAELTAIASGDGSAANTETDAMAPRLVSQSPASGAAGVARTASITMTFSEAINTSTDAIAFSPSVASTDAWSNSDKTFTMDPNTVLNPGVNTVTVTTAADVASSPNSFGGAISGTTTHPWSFTVASSNDSGGTTVAPTPVVYGITVTSPSVVEQLSAGQSMLIEWDWTGNASMSNVNLYYTTDGGITYTLIARNASNTGNYTWTLPNVDTEEAYIKVEGTDLVTVLASDTSSQFQITTGTADDEDVTDDEDEMSDDGDTSDDGMGPSPVTGELEAITEVEAGDYIKGASFDTVYWIDEDMVRHPFWDAQTYFTYEDSFDVIVDVSDATLPTLTLGGPMLPKAGVVLVKIQSDNRVYALADDDGETALRWVADENIAIDTYGQDWADYVIDIDVTLFTKFTTGTDVWMAEDVDTSMMKTRSHLAVLAQ
jgi:hypothetical protein